MKTLLALSLSFARRVCHGIGHTTATRPALTELSVMTDGAQAPTYYHNGETWRDGAARSALHAADSQSLGRRVEAVVSVDGRCCRRKVCRLSPKARLLGSALGICRCRRLAVSQGEAAAFRFHRWPTRMYGTDGFDSRSRRDWRRRVPRTICAPARRRHARSTFRGTNCMVMVEMTAARSARPQPSLRHQVEERRRAPR